MLEKPGNDAVINGIQTHADSVFCHK